MADTLAESPQSALSGVARVLVHAGKLNEKAAEALVKSARERKISFVAAVMAAGTVSPADLAHTLSWAALVSSDAVAPLLDYARLLICRELWPFAEPGIGIQLK